MKNHVKTIGDLMVRKVIAVSPDATVAEAARLISANEIGCVAVVEKKKGKKLIGIISERDITVKLAAKKRSPTRTKVKKIMSTKLFTVNMEDSLVKVAGMMHKHHIRHIPVVDKENMIVGILSIRDLLTRIEANLRTLVKERTRDLNVDALTGLYNYRFFNNYLEAEIVRSARHGHHLSLLFVDIDRFKVFNDTFGHARGDILLKEIADLLKAKDTPKTAQRKVEFSSRKSDIPVRVGGDEFILILPETSKEGALFCAERLRQAVEQRLFLGKTGQAKQHVTISIGVAEFPLDATNKKDLVDKADAALYQAKQLGRNRVYVYA
ncbi:MAG: GGDEF domain-containing protein [Candidatus Omnitrophica bacterium]|nr:GGDEF domain-containing protein [Candidatus Omnitrophota bacterium]